MIELIVAVPEASQVETLEDPAIAIAMQSLGVSLTDLALMAANRDLIMVGEEDGAGEIARRSRGTPRIANRLLRRVRDFAQVRGDGTVDGEIARSALEMLNVDEYGLDEMDSRILKAIIENFDGGPVGLNSLAVAVGEDASTLEEVYEPYLIQSGYLQRTARGRTATRRAFQRFGYALPSDAGPQSTLFGDDA